MKQRVWTNCSVPEQHAGVDQHVLDRPVLTLEPGRVIVQFLPGLQAVQDVADRGLVGVEVGDGATNVLLPAVAEQLQFRSVGTQDDPIRPDPMQAHRGVVEEVGKLPLAAP